MNEITLSRLMKMCAIAHEEKLGCWFFNLSGHVDTMEISFYPLGWKSDTPDQYRETLREELTPEGIAGLYYFVRNRTTR